MSRASILALVKQNQPAPLEEAALAFTPITFPDRVAKFTAVLEGIGGRVVNITSLEEIKAYLELHFTEHNLYVTTIAGLKNIPQVSVPEDHRDLDGIEVAVLPASFGVAENGSVWLSESDMQLRVLPFICQHLAIVLEPAAIVSNMHEAYARIDNAGYSFGAFIAGPSKTADIEQSLVLGAHGPKTMTIFLLNSFTR